MGTVTIRELRNRGGAVLERVASGETLTVTRDGEALAELRPLPRRPLRAGELVARASRLPRVDLGMLRADVDAALDTGLSSNLRLEPPDERTRG